MGKTTVKISFLFFAMLTVIFAMDEKMISIVAIFSVALHELGHIAAMMVLKKHPAEIYFGIFGVRIKHNTYKLSYGQELFVVICGPLVNAILFVTFFVVYLAFEEYLFLVISAVNLSVGAFNLLPVFALDGGRILQSVLSRFMSAEKTCSVMRLVSVSVSLAVVLAGTLLAVKTGANFSLLATGVYLSVMCIKAIKI